MQKREKILLIVLVSALVIWWGRPVLLSSFIQPVEDRERELAALQKKLDDIEIQEMQVLKATGKMSEYRERSLPSDAFAAQRAYTVWLTDLVEESGWTFYAVVPGKITRFQDLGSAVQVRIDGEANSEQLARFLAGFEHSGLLHRLERLDVQGSSIAADSPLVVSVTTEALALQASTQPDLDELPTMKGLDEFWQNFVADSPFTRQREFKAQEPAFNVPSVVRVNRGDRLQQKVEWSGFPTTEEPVKLQLEGHVPEGLTYDAKLQSLLWQTDEGTDLRDYAVTLVAASPSKPDLELKKQVTIQVVVPNTAPRLDAPSPQIVYPDEAWNLQLSAVDADQPEQELSYSLTGSVPAGLQIDSGSGMLQWTPAATLAGQTVMVQATVTDNGIPPASASVPLTLTVKPDEERSTELIGCVEVDGSWVAWFLERKQSRRFVAKVGETLQVGRYQAQVKEIHVDHIVLETESAQEQLQLGDKVAERTRRQPVTEPEGAGP